MRLNTGFVLVLAALLPTTLAVDQKKSAVVYFQDPSTPDSVISRAQDIIKEAGGKVTHVFTIIKGFAVIAPEKALRTVESWGTEHSMQVEEDKMVSTQ